MSTIQKISELEARRLAIQNGGSNQNNGSFYSENLVVRQRINSLLDENSFVEQGVFVKSRSAAFNMYDEATPSDGVVCGYGTIDGQLVYVYSQDPTTLGGGVGEMHAKKIAKVYSDAIKVGAPVIGFIDTVGLRLQESIDAIHGYGAIFAELTKAKEKIPTLAVIYGDCAGGASFIAGSSDFVFLVGQKARMFLNSPNTMDDGATFDAIAAPDVHLRESGLALFGSENEEVLVSKIKSLISYLPSSARGEVPCYQCKDDLNRMEFKLNSFDFKKQDVTEIMQAIADNNVFYPLYETYGQSAEVGFIRLNGATVGVLGHKDSLLDAKGIRKITRFAKWCDTFGVPLVTLTNTEGFLSTVETERSGIIYDAAKMVRAFVKAKVPKVNIILNAAYGTSYVAMNSHHIGADVVYAWPTAKMGAMNSHSAVRIMYGEKLDGVENVSEYLSEKEEQFEEANSIYGFAARGYIDDIIEPAATRKRIIAALEMLQSKHQ